MTSRPDPRALAATAVLVLGAVAIRIHDVLSYPADWGFDASFNWQYIHHLTQSWALPPPAAGWSSGDPPLYFYLSGAVLRLGRLLAQSYYPLFTVPMLSVAAGLGIAALAWTLVRRVDPDNPRRALLAAVLILYLPAHVQLSVMVNEEIFAALFTSAALLVVTRPGLADPGDTAGVGRAARAGLAGGLALLTKLSGALAILTAAAAYALDGLRRRTPAPAARRVAVLLLVAALVGGWYYARNRVLYGYFQPHGLPAHQVMFQMPPGERSLGDYLRVPLATFTDPQLLNPDLLRSVWGATYASLWFDAHRFFLPESNAVTQLGTFTLLLALLPSAAFAMGLLGGLRRALRDPDSSDAPLLLLTALTLAGYAFYTWQNPWFVVVKGSSLLGLSLPFAFYASETLERGTRRGGVRAIAIWLALGALFLSVAAGGTYNGLFERTEVSGLDWKGTP